MAHNGPYGLDYTAIESTFRLMRIPRSDWPELFDDLRLLEQGALSSIHEGSGKKS